MYSAPIRAERRLRPVCTNYLFICAVCRRCTSRGRPCRVCVQCTCDQSHHHLCCLSQVYLAWPVSALRNECDESTDVQKALFGVLHKSVLSHLQRSQTAQIAAQRETEREKCVVASRLHIIAHERREGGRRIAPNCGRSGVAVALNAVKGATIVRGDASLTSNWALSGVTCSHIRLGTPQSRTTWHVVMVMPATPLHVIISVIMNPFSSCSRIPGRRDGGQSVVEGKPPVTNIKWCV